MFQGKLPVKKQDYETAVIQIKFAARGGGSGGGLPYPFLKIEKSALILEKRP